MGEPESLASYKDDVCGSPFGGIFPILAGNQFCCCRTSQSAYSRSGGKGRESVIRCKETIPLSGVHERSESYNWAAISASINAPAGVRYAHTDIKIPDFN